MYFDIRKQKVAWILKCREQHKEAAENALTSIQLGVQNLAFTSTSDPCYNNTLAFMDTYVLISNS